MVRRRKLDTLLLLLLILIWDGAGTFAFKAPFRLQQQPKSPRSSRSNTNLRVSELHVPGYAKTKLPFLLADEIKQSITTTSPPETLKLIHHEDGHLLHKSLVPVFTAAECQAIVDEAERIASETAWTTNRHGNFPTTDLPLVELPQTLLFLKRALEERVYPALRHQFCTYLPNPNALRVADGFVVKYDAAGGQKELKPHRDGSVLSFNIALNEATDYEGGGTWFASLDAPVRLERGEMVSHASGLLHGGHGITSGLRYILVAFVIVEGYDSWSMRFYNKVRNL